MEELIWGWQPSALGREIPVGNLNARYLIAAFCKGNSLLTSPSNLPGASRPRASIFPRRSACLRISPAKSTLVDPSWEYAILMRAILPSIWLFSMFIPFRHRARTSSNTEAENAWEMSPWNRSQSNALAFGAARMADLSVPMMATTNAWDSLAPSSPFQTPLEGSSTVPARKGTSPLATAIRSRANLRVWVTGGGWEEMYEGTSSILDGGR